MGIPKCQQLDKSSQGYSQAKGTKISPQRRENPPTEPMSFAQKPSSERGHSLAALFRRASTDRHSEHRISLKQKEFRGAALLEPATVHIFRCLQMAGRFQTTFISQIHRHICLKTVLGSFGLVSPQSSDSGHGSLQDLWCQRRGRFGRKEWRPIDHPKSDCKGSPVWATSGYLVLNPWHPMVSHGTR